jgi:hypothetical protein
MVRDYSVECALPYTVDLESKREKFSLAFSGIAKQIQESGKTYSRVLLVDDVTNDAGTDYNLTAYTEASTGGYGSLVMRESMLSDLSDEVFAKLQGSLSAEELAELKTEFGYASSFYIAVWTLVRLGYLTHPDFPADQVSEKIVNVLPESFRKGEEKSLEILRKTEFPQAAEQVEYIFVDE